MHSDAANPSGAGGHGDGAGHAGHTDGTGRAGAGERADGAEPAEYRVVRLSESNLHDLDVLDKTVYHAARPPHFFRKKYATAYTGAQYLGYIAYNDQGMAIAYYGVMPCFLEYGGHTFLAAQSGDTMTHPEYRNKGLFVELARLTIALCSQEGVKLLFGFPNQNSYPGFINKLGWVTTGKMDCFCLTVNTLPLAGLAARIRPFGGLYKAWSNAVLKRKTLPQRGLPGSVPNNGLSGGLYRNDAYLEYKSYSDTRVIRLGKARAWIRVREDLVIGDLDLQGQDFDQTIHTLKKIAGKLGIRRLYFHGSPGTALHALFAARYTATPSFPVIFRDLGATDSGVILDRLKFTFADIDTF